MNVSKSDRWECPGPLSVNPHMSDNEWSLKHASLLCIYWIVFTIINWILKCVWCNAYYTTVCLVCVCYQFLVWYHRRNSHVTVVFHMQLFLLHMYLRPLLHFTYSLFLFFLIVQVALGLVVVFVVTTVSVVVGCWCGRKRRQTYQVDVPIPESDNSGKQQLGLRVSLSVERKVHTIVTNFLSVYVCRS